MWSPNRFAHKPVWIHENKKKRAFRSMWLSRIDQTPTGQTKRSILPTSHSSKTCLKLISLWGPCPTFEPKMHPQFTGSSGGHHTCNLRQRGRVKATAVNSEMWRILSFFSITTHPCTAMRSHLFIIFPWLFNSCLLQRVKNWSCLTPIWCTGELVSFLPRFPWCRGSHGIIRWDFFTPWT